MSINTHTDDFNFLDTDLKKIYKAPSHLIDSEKVKYHEFAEPPAHKDLFSKCENFYGYIVDTKQKHQYLYRRTLCHGSSARVVVFDVKAQCEKEMLMFASNSYLDLTTHPEVVEAAQAAQQKYGYGSGSVALLSGTYTLHRQLEALIAETYGREAAIVFPTGYGSNVGTLFALLKKDDLAILDMYSHASIVDGAVMSGSVTKYYKHNDMDNLDQICNRIREKFNGVLIATDGVFSMDGDLCPLPKLVSISKKYNARLLIDEAHAIGTIGETGAGTEEHFGLQGGADIIAGTLSKAPGGLGGYIAGSVELIEYLRHFANPYIFSTSLPPAVVGGLIKAFEIIRQDKPRRDKLRSNSQYFIEKLREAGFVVGPTETPIVPVILGDDLITKILAMELHDAQIFVSPVTYPAVQKNQARLRFSVMATHTIEDLDYVITTLKRLGDKYGIRK